MKALRIFLSIAAFFLSVVLFAVVVLTVVQNALFNSVKPETVVELLSEINTEELLPDLSAVEENIPEQYREIVRSEQLTAAVNEIFGSFAVDYLNHLLEGEGEFELNREKLDEIFYSAIDEYAKANDIVISEEDMTAIKTEYEKVVSEATELLPQVEDLISSEVSSVPGSSSGDTNSFGNVLSVLRNIVSSELSTVLMLAIAALCLLIALCKLSFFRWLLPCGLSALLAGGLIVGVSSLSVGLLEDAVSQMVNDASVSRVVESLLVSVINGLRSSGLVALIIGAVAVAAHVVLSCIFRKKKAPDQPQEA